MNAGPEPPLQLNQLELQQLKWLLGGVLALLSASTVLYLDLRAGPLLLVLAAAVGGGLWRPDALAKVPRWVHRLSFPFIVAFFTSDLWLTGELLPATVRLDLLLLGYRCITYRQRRDDLQLIILGLFLIVLAGVLTVSLAFVVQILAFTVGALALLVTVTLTQPVGGPAPAVLAPGAGAEAPAWARHVSWGRLLRRVRAVIRWRMVAFGAVLFVGLVGVSALLFVAIPRFQFENSFFLERFVTRKARTGFSDTIRFGEVTQITQDNSVAVSVDVSDRARIPAAPYWRMLVLDEYHDGTFRLSAGLRRTFGPGQSGTGLAGNLAQRAAADSQWTFYLESGVSRYLPLLGPFAQLRFRETQNYQFARKLGVVAMRAEPVTMLAYRVEGMHLDDRWPDPEFAHRLAERGDTARAAAALMLRVALPPEDQSVLARVDAEITSGSSLATDEYVRRATAWLAARHAYTLQPRIPAGPGDPLIRWMASREGGHCELFAGSLVLLARSAGFPARVVAGFRGGSWNAYSNNFTLRSSDAHAWCEVFDPASGSWLRADATPGVAAIANAAQRGDPLARRLDRSWTARLESLRVFWYRRIVSFDQRSQADTLGTVKDVVLDTAQRVRAFVTALGERIERWIRTPGRRWHPGAWTGLVAFAVVLAWSLRRFRFRVFAGLAGKRRQGDAVRRAAGRWLARFAMVGDAASVNPAVARVVADLQRLRFGPPESWRRPDEVFARARHVWRRRGAVVSG